MTKEYFKCNYEQFMADEKYTDIAVYVSMPDLPILEMIQNQRPNFENKYEYYLKAYNDDMELNTFNQIYIHSIMAWDSIELEWVNMVDLDEPVGYCPICDEPLSEPICSQHGDVSGCESKYYEKGVVMNISNNKSFNELKLEISNLEELLKQDKIKLREMCQHKHIEKENGHVEYGGCFENTYNAGRIKCLDCGLYSYDSYPECMSDDYRLLYSAYQKNRSY